LLVQTAPDQEDLLDIPSDAYSALRAQAEKFTPAELSRVLALLLVAQNDMRWTTSPRLTLELALVRACVPETDPTPAGVVARLERLERLANVVPGAEAAVSPSADPVAPPASAKAQPAEGATPPPPKADAPKQTTPKAEVPEAIDTPAAAATAAPTPAAEGRQLPVPHAADASSVDVAMLRRSWGSLVQHLGQSNQPVLRALMESATPSQFDGTTLELAFPPTFRNTVKQVESREDALRVAIQELFGITPAIVCVVREARAGDTSSVEPVEEDDAPGDDAEALRRVQEMLGAQPVDGA
jgi:DNA polymerase-3 subunit gamma/tau